MGKLKVGFGRTDITPPDGLYVQGYYTERRGFPQDTQKRTLFRLPRRKSAA